MPATLDQVLEARLLVLEADEAALPKRSDALAAALKAFEDQHGGIRDRFFGKRVDSAALLLADGRIKVRYPPDLVAMAQPEFEEAVWRTIRLAHHIRTAFATRPPAPASEGAGAVRRLAAKAAARTSVAKIRERDMLLDRLFSVLVLLLGVLDSVARPRRPAGAHTLRRVRRGDPPPAPHRTPLLPEPVMAIDDAANQRVTRVLETANRELDVLEAEKATAIEHFAVKSYLLGMPVGVLLVVGIVALGFAQAPLRWLPLLGLSPAVARMLGVALTAGALGAVISVMARVSNGELRVSAASGWLVTFIAGVFRPLLGGVLAAVIAVLLGAGWLPYIAAPVEGQDFYFYASLGFIAGFSERWAQDQVIETSSKLTSRT